jgi:hypothetical protein
LPALAAPARAPVAGGPTGDARDLPRELPPLVEPRRGGAGCLVVGLASRRLLRLAVVFLTVRNAPPSAPPPSSPLKSR